jgi:small subunit ribosomal protein S16
MYEHFYKGVKTLVKIRLTRLGKHKDPFYRIVATDSRTKRDGKYIALLGTFEPSDGVIKIKKDLVIDFLIKGAQPTETILNMLKEQGI